MATVLLPLIAGTWPPGYCPSTYQELLNTAAANMQAQLDGTTFFNYGDVKPGPAYEGYPWLRTTDMKWYYFSGVWRSPNNYSNLDRRWFPGTLTELITYDGGSVGPVTPTSGPMWVEDEDWRGRSPIGPGAIPGADPAKTLAVGEDYGAGSHALTEAEGGVGNHVHPIGVCDPSTDDGFFPIVDPPPNTVPAWSGHYITGGGSTPPTPETTANLYSLKAGVAGAGVPDPDPISIVHPVRGLYLIKPSGRQYYTVP